VTTDAIELTNYRPISLVSEISKVLEKLAKMKLQKCIISTNSINKMKFEFRERTGSEDAIACLANLIYSSFDKGKLYLGLFLDVAKAYLILYLINYYYIN